MDTAVMPDQENTVTEKVLYRRQLSVLVTSDIDRTQHKFWVAKQGTRDDWEDGDDL